MITKGLEDYLEIIYNSVLDNKSIRAVDIAKKLNVSRSSVSEALIRLADSGLIVYSGRKGIEITDEGAFEAEKVVEKHRILNTFLKEILGLNDELASQDACKIEHVISSEAIEKIDKFCDFCLKNEICNKFKNKEKND